MPLPNTLRTKLEDALSTADQKLLQAEQQALSTAYRTDKRHKEIIQNSYQRLAYLAARVPATYSVCEQVFARLAEYDIEFDSMLDIGAGPGTASICASYIFPEIGSFNLIDQDAEFKIFAESFLTKGTVDYQLADMTKANLPKSDLVTLSYSLNEVSEKDLSSMVARAWEACTKTLVIIDPGTPKAFSRLKDVRAALIEKGAALLGPCPHENACPMVGKDWCHFSVRLERTPLHKKVKGADLSYEDEKFSYLIATKSPLPNAFDARVIKRPLKRSGHIILDLCTQNGLERHTFSKKTKELYKHVSQLDWGDSLTLQDNHHDT